MWEKLFAVILTLMAAISVIGFHSGNTKEAIDSSGIREGRAYQIIQVLKKDSFTVDKDVVRDTNYGNRIGEMELSKSIDDATYLHVSFSYNPNDSVPYSFTANIDGLKSKDFSIRNYQFIEEVGKVLIKESNYNPGKIESKVKRLISKDLVHAEHDEKFGDYTETITVISLDNDGPETPLICYRIQNNNARMTE